ncbi:MAG: protein-L-isoaspartate(D-aspartate) O-methyltransferase [Nitrospiria bacterium]
MQKRQHEKEGTPLDVFEAERFQMVEEQLIPRGIQDERVLTAMRRIPRHLFVEPDLQHRAYEDHALPIGSNQTISQPYIVALMTEALCLRGSEKVLEIGSGSGYQTAVLATLAAKVYSMEYIKGLISPARKVLDALSYHNVCLRHGDGTYGWEDAAPFDAVLVAAGGPEIPDALVDQLKIGGRMVMPVGTRFSQTLKRIEKKNAGIRETSLTSCVFVPLVGKMGWEAREAMG